MKWVSYQEHRDFVGMILHLQKEMHGLATERLEEEIKKLKETLVGYDHLLRALGGVTIEKVINIKKEQVGHKKEIRELKKENKELKSALKKVNH
jgi:hypothetical protein